MKVLYHSVFLPNPCGHGGEKRSCQLQEKHLAEGIELVPLRLRAEKHLSFRCLFFTTLLLLKVYGLKGWRSPYVFARHVRNLSLIYDQLIAFFRDQETDTFYWESTGDYWYFLPFLASRYGKQVIAFPHNLESLVHGKQSAFFNWNDEQRLCRELQVLRQCQEVYTISYEETWFLRLMNINAKYLPYRLPKDVQTRCEEIGKERLNTTKDYFLILGSAINIPTRIGIETIITNWQSDETLIVAGYGTECLTAIDKPHNIHILGTVTEEQLYDLQTHCKALIVNQPPTTGALTRIEEFLVATIPVIANTDAVSLCRNSGNIYQYNDIYELYEIINLM